MINPAVMRAIINKPEAEAIQILQQFNCIYRVVEREGVVPPDITNDRNDKRYSLIVKHGKVVIINAG